ncbi:MAG: rhodanese-like domain-containing protein [Gammaproteobacteria bacterium]|nr:rhodanese-like domain-containing protein [Gammaproteobacteria bacterium]
MKALRATLLVLLGTLLVSGTSFAEKKEVPPFIDGTTRVSAEDLIELVEGSPQLVILDARKKSDFQKGFIEGAISLPNTETTKDSLAKHVKSKTTPIVFYCNGVKCGRSVKSAKVALAAGYKKVYWFRGGMEEWEAKGLPVVHP